MFKNLENCVELPATFSSKNYETRTVSLVILFLSYSGTRVVCVVCTSREERGHLVFMVDRKR